jgi:phosphoglycerate dehydrogenase-like enzyme
LPSTSRPSRQGKKIVATDTGVSREIADQVSEASRRRFEIRDLKTVEPELKGDVEVLILRESSLVGPALFEEFPNLKVLQSMSAGVDFINISSIPKNVVLCSNAGAYKEPIAEHVFAMILFFAKHLDRNHQRLKKGIFDNSADATFLAGKTIGVIGAGGIGSSVARVAKALNMRTIGLNTSGRRVPSFDAVWKMDRIEDLLKEANFVVISLPLNINTRNLIDAEKLGMMKDDATLVNVARGPIISQPDLYSHLKTHPNFRAGIDVWWVYPEKGEKFSLDFQFFDLPNFLASPHVADGVPEASSEGQRHALENVLRYLSGKPLERVIDKADYKGFKGAHH